MKRSNIYINVGQRIRALRLERGLSQELLALKAGVNRGYTGAIENGKKRPSLDTLQKLACALDVELYRLFTDEDET